MKTIVAMMAALAIMSGCQTDALIQANLPQVCGYAKPEYVAFVEIVAAAAPDKISPKTVRTVRAAWDSLEPLCDNPSSATTGSVLVAAIAAYITIKDARAEAEAAVD